MRVILFLCVLLCFTGTMDISAQTVPLMKLGELKKRIEDGKDSVFIVKFWASWCVSCLKEMPHFEKFTQTFKRDKVKVLLISLDFKSDLNTAVIPLVKKLGLKNEVYLLDEQNQQTYIDSIDKSWSGALPATLIVNNAKNKRKFHEGEYTFDELVKNYQQNK